MHSYEEMCDQSIVLSLDDILACVETTNIHAETNTGDACGREVW